MPGHKLPEWFANFGNPSSLVPTGPTAAALRPPELPELDAV
jgi:hypothetical protein